MRPAVRAIALTEATLRLTQCIPIWIEPASKARYRGAVAPRHGPDAISGGEFFAMALMGRMPRVVRGGENTRGRFSDIWGRRLPNGWTIGSRVSSSRPGPARPATGSACRLTCGDPCSELTLSSAVAIQPSNEPSAY